LTKQRTFTGYYNPKNKSKYVGDRRNIYYRSSWERSFCKWCDVNPKVKKWAIEPFEISYFDRTTRKKRNYNPDFWVEMDSGEKFLVEIKPDYETRPPKMREGTPKYLLQEATYITNTSKWEAADAYCRKKGWKFKVLTEKTLEKMGIKLLKKIPPMKRKGTSKKNVKYTNGTRIKRKNPTNGRKKVNTSCQ
jgi:hypothetical protein